MAGRLTPEREAELYAAVLDLLREVGYDALTMDAVATRTRSSKATLYRQWGSKPELVARALRHNKPVESRTRSTPARCAATSAMMVAREDDCQMEKDSALMRGLFQAVHDNPELLQALRELLIEPEIPVSTQCCSVLWTGVRSAADNPALRYVVHMMVGAFVARQFIEDRPIDQDFLADYIDAVVLPALGV